MQKLGMTLFDKVTRLVNKSIKKHSDTCSNNIEERIRKVETQTKIIKWAVIFSLAGQSGEVLLNHMHGWDFILNLLGY